MKNFKYLVNLLILYLGAMGFWQLFKDANYTSYQGLNLSIFIGLNFNIVFIWVKWWVSSSPPTITIGINKDA